MEKLQEKYVFCRQGSLQKQYNQRNKVLLETA